jgi:hypothetical protein
MTDALVGMTLLAISVLLLPNLFLTAMTQGAYSDEFVLRFRGYSSSDSNLKSSTRSNGFRPSLGASATARLFLPSLV